MTISAQARTRSASWSRGKHSFPEVLKGAERPMIAGRGRRRWRRPDGAAVASLAAKAAIELGAVKDGWNGFSGVCTPRRSRVGALDIGFVPGDGGLDAAEMATAGARSTLLFLLGADEVDVADRGAFVVYIGTHGDNGAHRADVILPGAAYHGEIRASTSTPKAACRSRAAPASRPATRARIGRSSARCPTCSAGGCPMNSLPQLHEAMFKAHPHLLRIDQITPGDPADVSKLAGLGGRAGQGAVPRRA